MSEIKMDIRHGTSIGYTRGGCREECCRRAHTEYVTEYRKRAYLAGGHLRVPSLGARRRVQALMCLGWSMKHISLSLGHYPDWARLLLRSELIHRDAHQDIVRFYDKHCMTIPPPSRTREHTRAMARNDGFVPPLAWDDIDDPTADPINTHGSTVHSHEVDDAVVLRLLDGERLTSTRAEKTEAIRRWVASGRTEKALCDIQGWKSGRYGPKPVDVGWRNVGHSRETRSTHECPEPVAADPGPRPLASEDVIAMTSVPPAPDNAYGGAA